MVGFVGSSVTRFSGSSTQNVGMKRWQARDESMGAGDIEVTSLLPAAFRSLSTSSAELLGSSET